MTLHKAWCASLKWHLVQRSCGSMTKDDRFKMLSLWTYPLKQKGKIKNSLFYTVEWRSAQRAHAPPKTMLYLKNFNENDPDLHQHFDGIRRWFSGFGLIRSWMSISTVVPWSTPNITGMQADFTFVLSIYSVIYPLNGGRRGDPMLTGQEKQKVSQFLLPVTTFGSSFWITRNWLNVL